MTGLYRRIGMAVLLAAATVVLAQEPPPAPDPEPEERAEPDTRDEAGAEQDTEPSGEDFVPSERIPADASIAFPVDI